MNIKKSLSLIAFGFLFILININLTLNGATVNVMPDFVGWILFFLAFGCIGTYGKGYTWSRWLALVLAVLSAAEWAIGFIKPEIIATREMSVVNGIVGIGECIFIVLLFGPLIRIARDFGSRREGTFRTLRIVDLIMYAIALCTTVLANYFITPADAVEPSAKVVILAVLAVIEGIGLLVCAIITAVAAFGLRKEVTQKLG